MEAINSWWQSTTIYQVYPRSFKDSTGNGIGDLKGIISKLDYIKDLGFETIWFSPFYKSPQQDHGYDVSDYYSIEPDYGDMDDAIQLIQEVHKRDMKIVFDMVLNHTSIEHPWFKESASTKDNEKRDWYIWEDGKGASPPNNWKSMVGKKGWNYDEKTDQWFYSNFLDFQPDLNFNHPDVKKEMFNVLKFWLGKGVDGFRLDIFNSIYKDESLKDNPFIFRYFPSEANNDEVFFQKKIYNFNHPKTFDLAKEVRGVIDSFKPARMLLGEVSGKDDTIKKYFGDDHDGLNLIFMFETVDFEFKADFFKDIIKKFEEVYPYPYIPTYVYGNHDTIRHMSKIKNDHEKAKCLALFQLTARGVPVVYYGEEIGMTDMNLGFRTAEDPIAQQRKSVPKFLTDFLGLFINRDRCRTPMQWNTSENGGFSPGGVKTWLPVNGNSDKINVELQQKDQKSLVNTYKEILGIRKKYPSLQKGAMSLKDEGHKDLLMYIRDCDNDPVMAVINFGNKTKQVKSDFNQVLFSTNDHNNVSDGFIWIEPCSGLLLGP